MVVLGLEIVSAFGLVGVEPTVGALPASYSTDWCRFMTSGYLALSHNLQLNFMLCRMKSAEYASGTPSRSRLVASVLGALSTVCPYRLAGVAEKSSTDAVCATCRRADRRAVRVRDLRQAPGAVWKFEDARLLSICDHEQLDSFGLTDVRRWRWTAAVAVLAVAVAQWWAAAFD
jgi:hypothetical protein